MQGFLLLLAIWPGLALAQRVTYKGTLASDPQRRVELSLMFRGSQASGTLNLPEICQQNARLPGAAFTFSGTVNGPWEDCWL